MGSPVIFSGNFAKFLKSQLNLNNAAYILTGTADPTTSATDAPQGSVYLRTGGSGGVLYTKLDAGSTTNWIAQSTSAGLEPIVKSTAFTAVAGKNYLTDCSGGGFTATLPTGAAGTSIGFVDDAGDWDTNNLTIAPASGQQFQGMSVDEALVCDVPGGWVELNWDSVNSYWTLSAPGYATSITTLNATFTDYTEQSSTPASPSSGKLRLYGKTDDNLYFLNSGGTEQQVGSGSGEKNYIATGASTSAGWTVTGSMTAVATDTTAAEIPRPNTTKSAAKFAGGAAADYAYKRFTLDDADFNVKLKWAFAQVAANGTDWKVEVYSNTASAYNGTSTELPLSTDSSGDSLLPGLTGQYRTTFDAPGALAKWLEIRVIRVAGTSVLTLSDMVVGPGIGAQGAAVGPKTDFTPSWTNLTLGTGGTTSGYYYRVGEFMHLFASVTFGTGGAITNSLEIAVPNSLTGAPISENKAIGDAWYYDSSATQQADGSVVLGTTGHINFLSTAVSSGGVNATVPWTWASGDIIRIEATLPIAEWAGTINVVQNDVEFASNSDTSGSSDTTHFAYGPSGSVVPSITAASGTSTAIKKRVSFTTPISSTDQLVLQFQNQGTGAWLNIEETDSYGVFLLHGASAYGVGLTPVDSTHVDVSFYPGGRFSSGSAYTDAGASFPRNSTDRYRVKKCSGGQAVGFGLVQPGVSAGLVSASGLKGRTDGASVGAGYVGETIAISSAMTRTATVSADTEVDVTNASLPLTAGSWLIYFSGTVELTNVTGGTVANSGRLTLTDSSNNKIAKGTCFVNTSLTTGANFWTTISRCVPVTISSATTYKLRITCAFASTTGLFAFQGNTDIGVFTGTDNDSYFYAVRIA